MAASCAGDEPVRGAAEDGGSSLDAGSFDLDAGSFDLDGGAPLDGGSADAGSAPSSDGGAIEDGGSASPDGGAPLDGSVALDGGGGLSHLVIGAARAAWVTGTIVDDESGQPLGTATFSVAGGPAISAASNGGFAAAASTGRVVVTFASPGYIAVVRELSAGHDTSFGTVVRLRRPAAAVSVGPAGGTVAAGGASLMFAVGAYGSAAMVSATWIGGGHLAAAPGPVGFQDDAGIPHRLLGALSVEASAQPAVAATVAIPVPTDANAASLSLYELVDGGWSNPVPPDSLDGGIATFRVTHFSGYGPTLDGDATHLLVEVATGSVRVTPPGGVARAAVEGEVLPLATNVETGAESYALLVLGTGTRIEMSGETSFTWSEPSLLSLLFGKLRLAVTKRLSQPDLRVRTGSSVIGVRGTVFTVGERKCVGSDRVLFELEVTEGDVSLEAANQSQDVAAPNEARGCSSCSDATVTTCDPDGGASAGVGPTARCDCSEIGYPGNYAGGCNCRHGAGSVTDAIMNCSVGHLIGDTCNSGPGGSYHDEYVGECVVRNHQYVPVMRCSTCTIVQNYTWGALSCNCYTATDCCLNHRAPCYITDTYDCSGCTP